VDALLKCGAFTLSMVAEKDSQVVGQILNSPVIIVSESGNWQAVGMGSMALLLSNQRWCIGSELIRESLRECKSRGDYVVFLLGRTDYYLLFRFRLAYL
jgi:putative acetyltransferase